MADGRLARLAGGLGLGYLHTIVGARGRAVAHAVSAAPARVARLRAVAAGAQVLVYLALMDLGVVALVPREVAFAAGRGRAGALAPPTPTQCRSSVRRTSSGCLADAGRRAVAAIAVVVAAGGVGRRSGAPSPSWSAGFVVAFPLRMFAALLQGLQDLAFLGSVQLAAWIAGTATTVALAFAGFGLYALAAGWVVTQLLPAAVAWRRVATRFASALPARPRLRCRGARRASSSARGAWISVESDRAGAARAAPISSWSGSCSGPRPSCRTPAPAS